MAEIRLEKGDSIEIALKKFLRECQESGVIKEVKKRRAYEKPSERKKRKQAESLRKMRKKARQDRTGY